MARKTIGDDGWHGTATSAFTDHNGQKAISVYWGRAHTPGAPFLPPLWSFQFYVTFGPTADSDQDLPRQLLEAAKRPTWDVYPIRLDVNFLPGADAEKCMEHYRAEKVARQETSAPLPVTDPYEQYSKFSFLVMIEQAEWDSVGGTKVIFDQEKPDEDDPDQHREPVITRNVEWGTPSDSARPDGTPYLGQSIDRMTMTPAWDEGNELYEKALEQGRSDWN